MRPDVGVYANLGPHDLNDYTKLAAIQSRAVVTSDAVMREYYVEGLRLYASQFAHTRSTLRSVVFFGCRSAFTPWHAHQQLELSLRERSLA